ncbi:MAG: archaeosortase/exosortase family protein [Bacteroidales bacterium]|nr:archaeosortase/exosortase family protein [Bacteroidales bacterium]
MAVAVGLFFYLFLKQNYFFFAFYEEGVYLFIEFITTSVKMILNLFDFNCESFGKIISITNGAGVILDRGCVGRNVLLVFSAFIIATPAEVKRKIIYTFAGLGVIVVLNIIRIILLMLVGQYYPDYFNFTHEYLFKYTLYAGVFLLWVFWVRRFRFSSSSFSQPEKERC